MGLATFISTMLPEIEVSAVRAAKSGGDVVLLVDGNETMHEVLQQVMRLGTRSPVLEPSHWMLL